MLQNMVWEEVPCDILPKVNRGAAKLLKPEGFVLNDDVMSLRGVRLNHRVRPADGGTVIGVTQIEVCYVH